VENEEAIRRGKRAQAILDDDMVKEAFADLEGTIIGQWCALGIENKAQAEELKRLLWAAQQFKAIFEVTISGSKVAMHDTLNSETMKIRAESAKERVRSYG
jgi:hypothetical protein